MTPARLTVRVATSAGQRQSAVDEWSATIQAADLDVDGLRLALIVEGALAAPSVPPQAEVRLLAPGCVCCIGQLPLQVALTRLLRSFRPTHLLLLLASGEHRAEVRKMLQAAPFAPMLAHSGWFDEDAAR